MCRLPRSPLIRSVRELLSHPCPYAEVRPEGVQVWTTDCDPRPVVAEMDHRPHVERAVGHLAAAGFRHGLMVTKSSRRRQDATPGEAGGICDLARARLLPGRASPPRTGIAALKPPSRTPGPSWDLVSSLGGCNCGCSRRRSLPCAQIRRRSNPQINRLTDPWRTALNAIMTAWQCDRLAVSGTSACDAR